MQESGRKRQNIPGTYQGLHPIQQDNLLLDKYFMYYWGFFLGTLLKFIEL